MARGGTVSDATMTRMQELGSAWVFKRAIHDKDDFTTPNDNVNDKKPDFHEFSFIHNSIKLINGKLQSFQ